LPPSTELYTLSLHDALPISRLITRRARFVKRSILSAMRLCLVHPVSLLLSGLLWIILMLSTRWLLALQHFLKFRANCVRRQVESDRKSTRLNSSHVAISYAV